MLGLQEPDAWYAFVNEALPALRDKGWRVTMSGKFRFNVIEIDAIETRCRLRRPVHERVLRFHAR